MKFKKGIIIDGYVDEPASFGVPPYIGTYPRYIAGILKHFDIPYDYATIDMLREDINLWKQLSQYDLIVVISGMTVPGKYVGGSPATLTEIQRIGETFSGFKVIGGPIKLGYSLEGKSKAKPVALHDYDIFAYGDIEAVLEYFLSSGDIDPYRKRNEAFLKNYAVLGAEVITKHPNFPYVISEVETSRGCERDIFCSYCTEPFYGKVDFRDEEDIVSEVAALYSFGERYFRIGRQANIVAYKGKDTPNIAAVTNLYEGIRKAAPDLKVLHTDNGNAGYIARFPDESYEILSVIAKHNTEGDILAFGVESFDKNVISANHLKSNPDDVIKAVRIVNEAGKSRVNGIPKLIPGINLIYGLIGESNDTFETNYRYLNEITNEGLLLRRINIRKVMVFDNTKLGEYYANNKININEKLFKKYKTKIREEIDNTMLKRVFPAGEAILRDVIPEYREQGITFGRQLGTYPILCGIPKEIPLKKPVDIAVTSYGFRSVSGVEYPLSINHASLKEIEELPGIGKKRAKSIIENRPFSDSSQLKNALADFDNFDKINSIVKYT